MDLSSPFPCVAMSVRHSWCCTQDSTQRISHAEACCANTKLLLVAHISVSKYSHNAANFSHCLSLYCLRRARVSSIKRIKTYLRSNRSEDRLNYRSGLLKYPLQGHTTDGGGEALKQGSLWAPQRHLCHWWHCLSSLSMLGICLARSCVIRLINPGMWLPLIKKFSTHATVPWLSAYCHSYCTEACNM